MNQVQLANAPGLKNIIIIIIKKKSEKVEYGEQGKSKRKEVKIMNQLPDFR